MVLSFAPSSQIAEAEEIASTIPFAVEGDETSSDRAGTSSTAAAPLELGGRPTADNVDRSDLGAGGELVGAVLAMRFTEEVHPVLLFDSPLNNLRAAQAHRIRTARDRASLENRRATPNADVDAFLASGDGVHRERRPLSRRDARGGAPLTTASQRGGESGSPAAHIAEGPDSLIPRQSRARQGTERDAPNRGIAAGRGAASQEAARVAHGRPEVDRGPAATPSRQVDSRVRDNADAELLAASLAQSWVQASGRRGQREGAGAGGRPRGGVAGTGGHSGSGGQSQAHGPGSGRDGALDTRDSRYRRWLSDVRRRVERALVFPHERAVMMDQGTTVLVMQLGRSGEVDGLRVRRSSGFMDFDEAALSAVRSVAPLPRIPDDLAPELSRLNVVLSVAMQNPMVH